MFSLVSPLTVVFARGFGGRISLENDMAGHLKPLDVVKLNPASMQMAMGSISSSTGQHPRIGPIDIGKTSAGTASDL
jgi:hypothetical protein